MLLERTGEVVGGVLLIALGAFSLWVAFSQQLYGHSHAHSHGEPGHAHWHVHLGPRSRHATGDHSHVPGMLGAVFAVSGLRALTMMAPFGDAVTGSVAASVFTLLYLIAVFAVGIVISMSLFGVVLSRVLGSVWLAKRVGRGAAVLTALASIGLGLYWIVVQG